MLCRNRKNACVDLADLLLFRGGVFLLDDRNDLALRIADNAAIPPGVIHGDSQKTKGFVIQRAHQTLKGFMAGKGNIAIKYQNPGVIRKIW